MKTFDPLPHGDLLLTCAGLSLNQEKLNDARDTALDQLIYRLTRYFGCVQVQPALGMGLELALAEELRDFAQRVAFEISSAYTEEALKSARQSTATMFEALAAGAFVTHRAVREGASSSDLATSFAAIAAYEGRPDVLNRINAEHAASETPAPAVPSVELLP